MTKSYNALKDFETLEEMLEDLKIQKPKNRVGKFLDKLGDKSMFGYNRKYLLTHPWVFFEEIWETIVKAWQRAIRGWSDDAIWSIDLYLAKLIPQLVLELKTLEKGIPTSMFEEGDWDDENNCYKPEAMERAIVKWDAILDEIAEGFQEYAEIGQGLCTKKAAEGEKFNRAFYLLKEYFSDLWD